MANIIRCWHEKLFCVERRNVVSCKTDLPVTFETITENNIVYVKALRGEKHAKLFKQHLYLGDFGYYAILNNEPIAYGWVKYTGSKDYFFKIGKNVCYLCRFFTHKDVRGHGVYPALITALIEHEEKCNKFYIDVENGNEASERGLKKVGFDFIKGLKFIRVMKCTLNKYILNN